MVQWDIKDKEISGIHMLILLFWNVPLCHLPSSSADFVPCDQVMQRAYWVSKGHVYVNFKWASYGLLDVLLAKTLG